nr:hypothetical protein [uncultured Draconibacterium sp.]
MTEKKQELAIKQNAVAQFNFFDNNHFAVMQRVCNMFAASELVPKMYQAAEAGKEKAIANCMIAVETANRIGASPLMVMQNMYIVHGQPAWSAKFLTATVNGCGRYNSIKYKWENLGRIKANGRDVDNWSCIAYTTEKGSDDVLESIPVTVEMAVQEGWYGKKGSKWPTMTKLMLQYRSVTFWTRAYAPELSMGMRTEDELHDIQDVSFEEIPAEKAKEEKANSKEISMDDASEEKKADPEKLEVKTDDKKVLDKMTFASMDEAKKFLVEDCGAAEEFLTDDNRIKNAAQEHGIEIEIKAAGGPGF